jgi:hypothetical protein
MLYNLYYSGQNSNLGVRACLINREEGSTKYHVMVLAWCFEWMWMSVVQNVVACCLLTVHRLIALCPELVAKFQKISSQPKGSDSTGGGVLTHRCRCTYYSKCIKKIFQNI